MIYYNKEWTGALGNKAIVQVLTFGVLIHDISIKMEASKVKKMEDKI